MTFQTFAEYQPLALRTEAPLPTTIDRLEHAALGLFTESGEIATPIKRIKIYNKTLDSLNKDGTSLRANIEEEIGDVCWYLAIGADAIQSGLFTHMLQDIQPLRREGVTEAQRLARASLGLAASVGRFASTVNQLLKRPQSHGSQENRDLHSSMFYIAQELVNICDVTGLNLLFIMRENIAKLQARFPDAFSAEAAEARADKGGLDARNS